MTKKAQALPGLTATRDDAGFVTLDLGGFACKLPPGIDSPEIRRGLVLYRDEIRRLIAERGRWSVGPDGVVAELNSDCYAPGPRPSPAARQSRPVEFQAARSHAEPR